ncbi:MAG: preprotein translocase subunit SecG [Clostridia bacterium]|nr:preprotein translocase subunit SecG [Clostridia bacterium]
MLYDVYSGLLIALMVVMVLLAVGMIVVVMMQSGNQNNLGAITGAAESFFGKNKAKTMEAKFKRWTVIIAVSMLVCSILFFVFYLLRSNLGL